MTRFLDRFRVILLDMEHTFLFDHPAPDLVIDHLAELPEAHPP